MRDALHSSSFPAFAISAMLWFAEKTETLRWDKQVPV